MQMPTRAFDAARRIHKTNRSLVLLPFPSLPSCCAAGQIREQSTVCRLYLCIAILVIILVLLLVLGFT